MIECKRLVRPPATAKSDLKKLYYMLKRIIIVFLVKKVFSFLPSHFFIVYLQLISGFGQDIVFKPLSMSLTFSTVKLVFCIVIQMYPCHVMRCPQVFVFC